MSNPKLTCPMHVFAPARCEGCEMYSQRGVETLLFVCGHSIPKLCPDCWWETYAARAAIAVAIFTPWREVILRWETL